MTDTTQFAPPATSLELDWSHGPDEDLLTTLIEATEPYASMTYRVVSTFGPAAGAPIVRFVAPRRELVPFVVAYCGGDLEQACEYVETLDLE